MGFGGQRHAPAALLPGKRPGTHFTEGCVGPTTSAENLSRTRSVQPVATRYAECAVPAHTTRNTNSK
jgi:hypothetical protein